MAKKLMYSYLPRLRKWLIIPAFMAVYIHFEDSILFILHLTQNSQLFPSSAHVRWWTGLQDTFLHVSKTQYCDLSEGWSIECGRKQFFFFFGSSGERDTCVSLLNHLESTIIRLVLMKNLEWSQHGCSFTDILVQCLGWTTSWCGGCQDDQSW